MPERCALIEHPGIVPGTIDQFYVEGSSVMSRLKIRCAMIAAASATLTSISTNAESVQAISFYGVGYGINGETRIGPFSVDSDMSFSDLLDHLEFGGMGAYRWDSDPWALQVDVQYVQLEAHDTLTVGPLSFQNSAELDQAIIEVSGGYQISERLELTFGARYWDYDVSLVVHDSLGNLRRANQQESWIDPFVGLHLRAPIGEHWSFAARGDVGGFGIGSDLAWHATALFSWHATPSLNVLFGYRLYDVDYETGAGFSRFGLDQRQSGPGIGMAFTF